MNEQEAELKGKAIGVIHNFNMASNLLEFAKKCGTEEEIESARSIYYYWMGERNALLPVQSLQDQIANAQSRIAAREAAKGADNG